MAIHEIHVSGPRALATSHYGPQEIEAWVAQLSPESFSDSIASKVFLVGEVASQVVGFGVLEPQTATVEALYVSPAVARRGVGSALLCALESEARAVDLQLLHLRASLNSVAFWERAGYRVEREGLHRTRQGTDVRCAYMAKELVP